GVKGRFVPLLVRIENLQVKRPKLGISPQDQFLCTKRQECRSTLRILRHNHQKTLISPLEQPSDPKSKVGASSRRIHQQRYFCASGIWHRRLKTLVHIEADVLERL